MRAQEIQRNDTHEQFGLFSLYTNYNRNKQHKTKRQNTQMNKGMNKT